MFQFSGGVVVSSWKEVHGVGTINNGKQEIKNYKEKDKWVTAECYSWSTFFTVFVV